MADGSMRFIANDVDPPTYEALGTIAGKELLEESF
jgi:hypothetical protein